MREWEVVMYDSKTRSYSTWLLNQGFGLSNTSTVLLTFFLQKI